MRTSCYEHVSTGRIVKKSISKRRRRVLFVVNDGPFFVSHRLPIAIAARRSGFEVHVAMPLESTAAMTLQAEDCRVHDLPLDRRAANVRGEWHLFRALC